MVVQQKCLDGGALVGEGSEVDFESIPFAKQNGNVVVVDIHNVIGRKWSQGTEMEQAVRCAFRFVLVEKIPPLVVELDQRNGLF